MKHIINLVFIVAIILVSKYGQAQGINFQGVARAANGTILASSNISLKLSIISKTIDATPEFVETKRVVTNAQGIFSIIVGDASNTAVLGSFKSINWAEPIKFLKVEMDPAGGSSYINMGTTQLQYVPFSYYSLGVGADNISGTISIEKGGTGVTSLAGLKTALAIDKINNTADTAKPISKLTQAALDLKANAADVITSAGLALKLNASDTSKYTKQAYSDSALLTKLSTTGNAATATKLATARNINGVAFDGSGDITITASSDAGTLTGTSLNSTITGSSLTSVGTLTNTTVNGKLVVGASTAVSSSAVLEASSTTQGFLPPRMTYAQKTNISSPVQGLIIYCTNCGTNGEPEYYNGIKWVNMTGSDAAAALPVITTTAISSINVRSASSGGNISSNGGGSIIAEGVCWSVNSGTASVTGSHTSDGTINGSFTSSITGLTPNTTYYVKAYATNSAGTSYGNEITFTTMAVTLPVITTTAITSIGVRSASSGGNISSNGGDNIIAEGVCWSVNSGTASVTGSHTTDGTINGSFTSSITGLTPNTTYYVKAYATNYAGTSYGNEITFTTTSVTIPVITTTAITSITPTSASSGGNISSNGGDNIIAEGVCWSVNSGTASVTGSHTSDGTINGSFTSSITGLTRNTTYYVKAYATNSAGTSYGNEITFTTSNFLSIGDSYQGGIVAYILQPGDLGYDAAIQHGLIAATSDQGRGIQWYNGSYTTTGATGTAIGTGLSNTNTIITSQGGTATDYAAGLARAYAGGGYTDWFLPSKDELNKLYLNRVAIGGFANWDYWSSSEVNNNNAWGLFFATGLQFDYANKSGLPYVRAIRSF